MASRKAVAEWMYQELIRDGELSKKRACGVITEQFGREFAPGGKIARAVLKEWQKLAKGKVVWNAPNAVWRLKPDVTQPDSSAELI